MSSQEIHITKSSNLPIRILNCWPTKKKKKTNETSSTTKHIYLVTFICGIANFGRNLTKLVNLIVFILNC